MYETKYHKPSSLAEAMQQMRAADDGKFLGGGQTLIPTMKQRLAAPSDLVHLTGLVELSGITVTPDRVTIGAATTHAEVAGSAAVKQAIPALAALASGIGDPHVRNMGTLGGSLANNDPAADYPSAVLALDALVKTSHRDIEADDFFDGLFATTLEEDEIITAVSFKIPVAASYQKFDNPASRYALAGVFVARFGDGAVRVAVTGAGADGVYRDEAMEQALGTDFSVNAIKDIMPDADMMMSDMHARADYRANLVQVMAKRAVSAAG